MRQLQQLIDAGLMEEHDGGWRPVYAEGICREPRVLTEEQREARRKAGSKGGRRKAANQKAKQTSGDLPENSQANGEQNGSETGSKPSSKLLEDSQAKTWHKTDTDTDIPSPTPPAGKPKQPATPESGFDHFAEAYPGSVGAKGRKTETEARALYAAIALVWRIKLCEILAMACAPIGAAFTVITLATGSIWGKPMWGTWWDWDPRLTTELILLFLYLGVIGLYHAGDDRRARHRAPFDIDAARYV